MICSESREHASETDTERQQDVKGYARVILPKLQGQGDDMKDQQLRRVEVHVKTAALEKLGNSTDHLEDLH